MLNLDTCMTPCPFCGRGFLAYSDAGECAHPTPTCETYDRIESLGHLADELARAREAGYPHGKPTLSGALPQALEQEKN